MTNSHSKGSVTDDHDVGGLVGYTYRNIVSNSLWDTETRGQTTSAGETGKTTAEMQDIGTFSDAHWDVIAVGLNETDSVY